MSEAPPIWRRIGAQTGAGRLAALSVALCIAGALCLLIGAPLAQQVFDARERALRLDQRAAALTATAAARRAEAAIAAPPAAAIEAAEAYLSLHAPRRDRDAALLDLVSTLRLLAQAADVELAAAAPSDLGRGDRQYFEIADDAGLTAIAAEVRIMTDHAGLARFLDAVERARPALRAAALEVTASNARADAEARRLNARIVVGALIRAEEG